MKVAVLSTGTANLASVFAAFRRVGAEPELVSDPAQVTFAEALVVPGVGAFQHAVGTLAPVARRLRDRIQAGRPTLGICLGFQVFATGSDEGPGEGLGVLPGRVVRLRGARVPHLGWGRVTAPDGELLGEGDAAFAHSFALEDAPIGWRVATVDLDGPVVAGVERGAVLGCQFHPELSGDFGLALLRRWLDRARGEALSPLPPALPRRGGPVTRVVPCLDVRDGRVVKGVRFQGLRETGDPGERAAAYARTGADQLVVLDVSATDQGRHSAVDTIRAVRAGSSLPLTAGGGVRSLGDAGALLQAGADQVGVNSAAVERPALLSELARTFGAQCALLALDAARTGDGWEVVTHAGRRRTGLDAVAWAREAVDRGAGEILLTSWDRDGTGHGYDLELLRAVRAAVPVPLVASGGASRPEHLVEAVRAGADAVLVASMLHDGVFELPTLKRALAAAGVEVRP